MAKRPQLAACLSVLILACLLASCSSAQSAAQVADSRLATPPGRQPAASTQEPMDNSPSAVESTPAHFAFSTPGPYPVSAWRPPPYGVPWAIRPEDHFYFLRPIPSGEVNWPNPSYRYGSTLSGEMSVHTGVDLDAPRGTPVLAAGRGQVVWVGFGLYSGEPNPKDPYGLAIAIRHDFGYQGKTLFTVYAHLQDSRVWLGQTVAAGQEIGSVGDTGNANGVHLHFEVRLGDDEYFATRNPELWIVPPEGWGVLAGQVLDTTGRPLPEQLIQIQSIDTGKQWETWTYALGTVHSDDAYGEDFAISDLPAGPYQVEIDFAGRPYTAQLLVKPGQTNLLTFRGRAGFKIEPPTEPTPGAMPPYR
jgi:murein DD-endopeptidase MepM/ murein hydrolase activator NlpD